MQAALSDFLTTWVREVRNDKRILISTAEISDALLLLRDTPFATIDQFLCLSIPLLGKTAIAQIALRKVFWDLFNKSDIVKSLFDDELVEEAVSSLEKTSSKSANKTVESSKGKSKKKPPEKPEAATKTSKGQDEKNQALSFLANHQDTPSALKALAKGDQKAAAHHLRKEPMNVEDWLEKLQKIAKEAGKDIAMHWIELLPIALKLEKSVKKSQEKAKEQQQEWLKRLKELEKTSALKQKDIHDKKGNPIYIASNLSDEDRTQVRLAVRRMAEQIRLTLSDHKLGKQKGLLNMPKTLRESLATYGEPIITYETSGYRRTRKFVTFVDLSGSMKLVAELLATVQYELHRVLQDDRHYVFVGETAEITDLLTGDAVKAASAVMHNAKLDYRAYSNYGDSLEEWVHIAPNGTFDDAVVFIMGDARNNRYDAGLEALRFVKRRAHQVIWMNPEVPHQWNTGDSIIFKYVNEVDQMLDISTLDKFSAVLKQLPRLLTRL